MKLRDLANLLNNAAAVLESGAYCISERELADLVDDLLQAAKEVDPPASFDGKEGTFSDHKCSTCKPLEVGNADDQ